MKKISPIVKVLISTLCLMIFLPNFIQMINADEFDCNNGLAEECIIIANYDCDDECEILDEECDYIQFSTGSCNHGTCDSWWRFYCTSGYIGIYFVLCFEPGCPFK